MKSHRLAWMLGACFAAATGCSLINSYDDVKQHPDNADPGAGGSSGSGGSAGDAGGSAGTSGTGGEAGSAGSGDDAGDAPDDTVLADTATPDVKADGDAGVVDADASGPTVAGAVVI